MKKILSKTLFLQSFVLLLLLTTTARQAWGQCTNGTPYLTVNAPTGSTPLTISSCTFGGEYNTINLAVAGTTYTFTGTGGTGNYITIRQGSPGGTVLAHGFSPVTATCTVSGSLYLHLNTDAGCGTDASCHTTTIQCTSCAAPPPGQCNNSTQYGSATIDPGGAVVTISSCNFAGEYSPISGAVSGQQLRFTSSFAGDNITIRSGTSGGPVVASGTTPLTFTNTYTGTLYAHWNLAGCGTGASCRVTTVQCLSCGAFDPCASTPTITCGAPTTASPSGSGAWNPSSCGFSTPGQERIFIFTPTTTGAHSLQVTSTSSTAYIDYFYKPVSSGCNATGWTCIDDIFSPVTVPMGTLTAGVPYYILLDPESTTSVTQTFQINCPAAGGPPNCLASPTSPTNGQINVCPSSTQNLSWPASAGATSYDVYFGTTASPVFVGSTAGTSFVATTPTNTTYYWQVRPVNANGAATGCTVWSFTKGDAIAPTITCPPNVNANNAPSTACSAVVSYGAVTATDNCTAPTITLVSGSASGSVFPVGVHPIVYRATDGVGNSSTCSFTVTVNDATAPTITCPANIVKNTDANLCGSITNYANPTFADNCGATLSQQSGLGSGALFPVGTTSNVFRAIDAAGNFAFCTMTVTVNDAQAPAITCPPALTLGNDVGDCGRAVSWVGQATASDNCGITGNSSNNPGYLPVGTHTVIHTVTDGAGNQSTCAQTVIIIDYEFPFIVCPDNIAVTTDDFDCIATVNYSVNAGDNCPGYTVDYNTPPFSAFEPGSNTVFATVTDAAGNESNCNFKVIVSTRAEICNDLDDDCDGLIDETDDWENVAKLFAPNGTPNTNFGGAVDIDGDYAIASSNNGVHIFNRNAAAGWATSAQLQAPGVAAGDEFGLSVALDSSFAAVGAPGTNGGEGAVYVFAKDAGNGWNFMKKITAADATAGDRFGGAIALDSLTLVVGSANNGETAANAGAAYVFYKDLVAVDSFGQAAKLLALTGNADDNMGVSVAIDGDHIVVGATGVDGFYQNSGAAYVFGRNQNGPDTWGQVARMRSQSSRENDNFGGSVGISGNYAIVGASQNDLKGDNAGAAFVFFRNLNGINDSWGQRNILYDFDGSAGENYGSSVDIQGKYAVVGAKNDNPYGSGSGRLYVHERQPDDNWLIVDKPADVGGQFNDNLGASVAISGRTIIAGMPNDDNGTFTNQGSVLFFEGICANNRPQATYRQETAGMETLRAYPVPFSDVLNIDVEGFVSNDVQITVINALGQTVADIHRGAVTSDMTLQWRPEGNISEGMYFLRLRTEEKTMTQTIVLSRQR